jgi:glutathione synthase/RimK-type ligase-like ATP-grasp enzyme
MDIANYSLVYVKSHWNYPELASALAEYLVYKSKPFFDRELSNYTSRGKLSESMKLATHGIPVPRLFAGYPKLIKSQSNKIISDLGFPFVLKSASADKGKDNYFVNDKATFNQLIDKISENDIYIAQAFIPNDGFYRINVFKNEAKLAIYRSRYHSNNPLKDHLNKPFGGINAKIIPIESLGSELVQLAVKSSIYMDREIAGVDIIQNKDDGKYYILEVNSSPQLRSGSYIDEKAAEFAKFIDKELKK